MELISIVAASLSVVLATSAPDASESSGVQTTQRAPSVERRPLETTYTMEADRIVRCDIAVSTEADFELVLQEVRASRPGEILAPSETLTLPVPGVALCGAIDAAELPGGDLLVGFTTIVGSSNRLNLVRVASERLPDGRLLRTVAATASFKSAALDALPGSQPELVDLFDGVALLVGPAGVSAFVGGHLPDRTVSKSDSVVVELALDATLQSIRGARRLCEGSDPRVRSTPSGFLLSTRRPADGASAVGGARLALLESHDGLEWTPRGDVAASPLVRPDYALGVVGREIRVSTPTDDVLVAKTWSLPLAGGEWRVEDTFTLAPDDRPGQRARIWTAHARGVDAGEQGVIARSPTGLVKR